MNHVFYFPEGHRFRGEVKSAGWYWLNENADLGGGPYDTEAEAAEVVKLYMRNTDMPEQSKKCNHVYWFPADYKVGNEYLQDGWYFFDETECIGGGPYDTEDQAIAKLNEYVAMLFLNEDIV
jgi:hypothetical protein